MHTSVSPFSHEIILNADPDCSTNCRHSDAECAAEIVHFMQISSRDPSTLMSILMHKWNLVKKNFWYFLQSIDG